MKFGCTSLYNMNAIRNLPHRPALISMEILKQPLIRRFKIIICLYARRPCELLSVWHYSLGTEIFIGGQVFFNRILSYHPSGGRIFCVIYCQKVSKITFFLISGVVGASYFSSWKLIKGEGQGFFPTLRRGGGGGRSVSPPPGRKLCRFPIPTEAAAVWIKELSLYTWPPCTSIVLKITRKKWI